MFTLKTYVAANASGIVEDVRGRLVSISFPDFELCPVEFHGNAKKFFELVMSQGQAVMRDSVHGNIVHTRADILFKDEAAVSSFLMEEYEAHLYAYARPSSEQQRARNFLSLLKRLAA